MTSKGGQTEFGPRVLAVMAHAESQQRRELGAQRHPVVSSPVACVLPASRTRYGSSLCAGPGSSDATRGS